MNKGARILIIGVGNYLLMDEGVGIHIINELEQYKLPQNVEIYDGGTGGFKLVDLVYGANKVIFIDAVDMGKRPGTVTAFKPEDVRSMYPKKKYSLHDTDLSEVIKMIKLLGNPPEIEIIGVQPETINYGILLTEKLKNSVPNIIQTVLNRIEKVAETFLPN
jgi:hydrogenase maturation protease